MQAFPMSVTPGTRLDFVRLREKYLEAIMEIEEEAYPEPWTIGMRQRLLSRFPRSRIYLNRAGFPVGLLYLLPRRLR